MAKSIENDVIRFFFHAPELCK